MNPGLAHIGILSTWLALAACHGKETDEVLATLRADNQRLRDEVAALRAENVALVDGDVPAWPGALTLKRVGGNNGRILYERLCPLGQALRGFATKSGSVIDQFVPVCAPVATLPGSRGPRAFERELAVVGGRGGRASDSMCPGEALVSGIRGRSADVVDALEAVCNGGQNGLRAGGEGGREYERLCPTGWLAVGVSGRHGDYVESLSLVCADPKAAGITVVPPAPAEIRRPPPETPPPLPAPSPGP